MSDLPYVPLVEYNSTPRGSVITLETLDLSSPTSGNEHLCRACKNKLIRKQQPDHAPMECVSQRCELLENETVKLKDRDIKSRIQIKDLESKLASLEEAIQSLTAPKQEQATAFSLSSAQKLRSPFKKAQSVDVAGRGHDPEVNYDNVLPLRRSGSRERIGLFGSLGASSQIR